MNNDLIIKNAIVINPKTKKSEAKDLYIADGKFVEKLEDGDISIFEAKGLYAAPAFIDIHVHVFENETKLGINADKVGIKQGVLKVVDAGSVGISYFDIFKKEIIEKNETEVLYFLNIAKKGLCEGLSELADLNDLMTVDELTNFMKKDGKGLVGLKVRMSSSVVKENDVKPLIHARTLADKTGLPLMIHIGNAPPKLGDVLNLLKKGDIVTHCFHGKVGGIPYYEKEYKQAVERGVHFDVGHGNSSFSYETIKKVRDISEIDYSISTDIYTANYEEPVKSLMVTMSKFMPLGLSLEDLVYRVTTLPSKVLNLGKSSFEIGEPADITLFNLNITPKTFIDSEGYIIKTNQFLEAYASVQKGKVVWQKDV